MTSSIDYPSLDPSVNSVYSARPCNLPNSVSTFSTHVGLAKALQERGVGQSIPGWSGLSTPNNSPGGPSPDGSPSHYFYNPLELLHQGAKMLRRTWTGEETPVAVPCQPVPRISRKELEVFAVQLVLVLAYKTMALNMFCRVAGLISDEFVGQIGETGSRRCE